MPAALTNTFISLLIREAIVRWRAQLAGAAKRAKCAPHTTREPSSIAGTAPGPRLRPAAAAATALARGRARAALAPRAAASERASERASEQASERSSAASERTPKLQPRLQQCRSRLAGDDDDGELLSCWLLRCPLSLTFAGSLALVGGAARRLGELG
jgi:hypothetical protein